MPERLRYFRRIRFQKRLRLLKELGIKLVPRPVLVFPMLS